MSGASSRQSQMVADEMFPDGPGPLDFVDVEDGVRNILGTECRHFSSVSFNISVVVTINRFVPQVRDGVTGPAGLLSELTASEKTVSNPLF